MATLVFSSIGTALGGPLGGAIGALAGRQLDGALFGRQRRSGPQLRELEVSLSSYGLAIPRLHGRMRVAGAIIWATELQEHSELQGGGKGQPALIAFSYAANLAVALSSRSIVGVGRIWADGKLLRGAVGDLKVGGTLRIHTGTDEQAVDPLIAASEGEQRCPAFRGLAYVVFEGLELTDFGNRLPALTFEVIADETVTLAAILGDALPGVDVQEEASGLSGFSVEDTLGDSLATLATVLPIAIDGSGETIVVDVGLGQVPIALGEPAAAVDDDAFGRATGATRRRASRGPQPPSALRYLDVDRDYQPGTQHPTGRAGPGQSDVVELPAALTTPQARLLVERMEGRRERDREQVLWRTTSLDTAIRPGTRVRLPDRTGIWYVRSWEWREAGVELELAPAEMAPELVAAPPGDPFAAPLDVPSAQTRLVAFELPWDGTTATPDQPRRVAAVTATGLNWNGAAIYADRGDGQLWPLAHASRQRAIVGTVTDALPAASPLLIDRTSTIVVTLAASDQALTCASLAELANGANLALIGDEFVQFARADLIAPATWRLSHLVRGRGGTESAISGHGTSEPFALVDSALTALGIADGAAIVAIGRGDTEPVVSPLRLSGIGSTPLAPVHGRASWMPDGSLQLAWTRRSRGAWDWRDGVDVPLAEEAERYLVVFEHDGIAARGWTVTTSSVLLAPADLALLPGGRFLVRQQGTHALSPPLPLAELA